MTQSKHTQGLKAVPKTSTGWSGDGKDQTWKMKKKRSGREVCKWPIAMDLSSSWNKGNAEIQLEIKLRFITMI